jgi:hypothetical protein
MLGRAWANKPGRGSKAVGIYVPADVDDEDNTIYGNGNTGYGDEAAPAGCALPGTKPARQWAHLRRLMAMTTTMPQL